MVDCTSWSLMHIMFDYFLFAAAFRTRLFILLNVTFSSTRIRCPIHSTIWHAIKKLTCILLRLKDSERSNAVEMLSSYPRRTSSVEKNYRGVVLTLNTERCLPATSRRSCVFQLATWHFGTDFPPMLSRSPNFRRNCALILHDGLSKAALSIIGFR